MSLAVLGLSHRTATIDVRERFFLEGDRLREAIGGLLDASAVEECVAVSTCNRTEYYYAGSGRREEDEAAVLRAMAVSAGLPREETRPLLYAHREVACVEHLYRVVSGLDSLVVGEPQIQGQVGQAYERARELLPRSVGPILHRLFQSARATGGRVRSETRISEGSASVPSAAVDLARKVFGSLSGRRALVIGAGKMGRLTLRCLRDAGVETAFVASRTLDRAARAGRAAGGRALEFGALWDRIPELDVVVTSTAAPHPILTAERLRAARAGGRPLVLLDIAVPRDIEPAAGDLHNVFLYNIDDLQRVVEAAEEARAGEMPAAEEIVREHAGRFWAWYTARRAVPLIREMREAAERIRRREIEQALADLDGLSEAERERIHVASRAALNKILHRPTTALRELAREAEGTELLEVARRLLPSDGDEEEEDGR